MKGAYGYLQIQMNNTNGYKDALSQNTLRLRQYSHHFTDDTFKLIFFNENVRIWKKISLRFVPKGPINNILALVQVMACCWPGNKPLSEPMIVWLLIHICVTRPQWVDGLYVYLLCIYHNLSYPCYERSLKSPLLPNKWGYTGLIIDNVQLSVAQLVWLQQSPVPMLTCCSWFVLTVDYKYGNYITMLPTYITGTTCRDHFVYPTSQWEMSHCNVVSHWLGAYINWSLHLTILLS